MLLTIIAGGVLSYVLGWILWIAWQHQKCSHIPGPKRTSFFFGNVALMKSRIPERGNFGKMLLDLHMEYGHVFILWRLTVPMLVTTDIPAVKEFFTNLKLFQKPLVGLLKLKSIGRTNFIGNHSILSDAGGQNWERKKRIMDPGFKISRLQEHISKFYLIGEQVADDLESKQLEAGFVDFSRVIAPYTIHAISSAGFSVAEEKTLTELSEGASAITDYWMSRIQRNPLRNTDLAVMLGLDGPGRKPAEKQLKHVRGLGKQLVLDRIESGKLEKANDALDFIIRANEEGGEIRMERCLDDFMSIYEAGNVTTSTTLSFFLAEMVRNPDILEKLVQEVDGIWVGRGISRSSSNQDITAALKDMVYLDAVINEVLRKHPPVTAGTRVLQKDMRVLDYKIPAGVWFVVSQQALQHHPQYWDYPERFDPTRFTGNKEIVPFTFVPFIVGPRRCLGKNFAILEMKVFISIWLSRMTFEKLPDTSDDIVTEQMLLVRPVDNRVVVKMRQ